MRILQFLRDNAARERLPVNVARNAAEATLYIYDAIFPDGWGIGAMDVVRALADHQDAEVLHVRINSPGGDVAEGRAIMAALGEFPGKKIAHIDSLCASAATSVALACNEIEAVDGSFFMIHNAKGATFGDRHAHRNRADVLEKIEGAIVADYVAKTGKEEDEIRALMDAETWFTAAEAVDAGFVDRVTQAPVAKARNSARTPWNLAAFDKVPAALLNQADPKPAYSSMSQTNLNRLRLLQVA